MTSTACKFIGALKPYHLLQGHVAPKEGAFLLILGIVFVTGNDSALKMKRTPALSTGLGFCFKALRMMMMMLMRRMQIKLHLLDLLINRYLMFVKYSNK